MSTNNMDYGISFGRWRTNYLSGFPWHSKPVGNVYLMLYPKGILFQSNKLGNPFVFYNQIKSIDIVKGPGKNSLPVFDAIFDARNIRIVVKGQYNNDRIIMLQMFSTQNTQKNAMECQNMISVMKSHGIFERLARPARSAETAQRTPESREDIFAKIEQLSKLHQSGALTDEEFQRKKKELLKRI